MTEWAWAKDRTDKQLVALFDGLSLASDRLKSAMQYAVLNGGKRLRPILVYLTAHVLDIPVEKLDRAVCAIECMHAYSLIHDDLPAMDNSDLRRGKPTCHRQYDEATAILAGDALQALAFQQILLTDAALLTATQKNKMAELLSMACGPQYMVSGQALDLECLQQPDVSEDDLKKIHALKTAAFLEVCIDIALAASESVTEQETQYLRTFAQQFGLAFQIQDDYLDAYGETAILGKQQGLDEQHGKMTYAALYSQQDLASLIKTVYQQALDALLLLKESRGKTTPLFLFIDTLSRRMY